MKILCIDKIPAPHSFDDATPSPGRSAETPNRVSVSTIKSYVSATLGLSKYDVDFDSPGIKMKAWLGMALEDRLHIDLAKTEPDRVAQPGEILSPSGGVMGHPDGFYFSSGGLTYGDFGVDEIKHSYTSSAHYTTAESLHSAASGLVWDYLFQLRSYVALLYAMGLNVGEGRLWVASPMGDWRNDKDPCLHCIRLLFSPRELEGQLVQLETDKSAAYEWKYNSGK